MFIAAIALLAQALPAPVVPTGWKAYNNSVQGISSCYPNYGVNTRPAAYKTTDGTMEFADLRSNQGTVWFTQLKSYGTDSKRFMREGDTTYGTTKITNSMSGNGWSMREGWNEIDGWFWESFFERKNDMMWIKLKDFKNQSSLHNAMGAIRSCTRLK